MNGDDSTKTRNTPKVEISVRNFGPIAEADLDLRPLTVFVGPSNTGKTYLSVLIYALHRIFEGFFRDFPLCTSYMALSVWLGLPILSADSIELAQGTVWKVLNKLKERDNHSHSRTCPRQCAKRYNSILKNLEIYGN